MKEKELRERANCSVCGRPVGPAPVFYTLTIETWLINFDAIRRQDGLAQYMGSSALAMVLATSSGSVKITMCLSCMCGDVCLAEHTAPKVD